jgi:hypothetical protein
MGKEWSGKRSQLFASASSGTLELSVPREKKEIFRTATAATCGFITHISYRRKSKRSVALRKQRKQSTYNVILCRVRATFVSPRPFQQSDVISLEEIFLRKFTSIKFHENPSSGSGCDMCRQKEER